MKKLDRRGFFKWGAGVATTAVASSSLAQVCTSKTAVQPLGPFFPGQGTPEFPVNENPNSGRPIALSNDSDLTYVKGRNGRATGQVVYIAGKIQDINCRPIPGATIIIWQASAKGRYNHQQDQNNKNFRHPVTGKMIQRGHDPYFQYWGASRSNAQGEYLFKTIIPGFYPANIQDKWYRPPHIHFMVSASGYPQMVTQMYFRGPQVNDNTFIQELNKRDLLLQNNSLTPKQKEDLIVDFRSHRRLRSGELIGNFNISLERSW